MFCVLDKNCLDLILFSFVLLVKSLFISVSVVPKLVKFKNLTEILLRLCCFLLPVAGAGLDQGYLFSEGSLTAYAMEGLSISRNGCFCNAKSP